MQSSLYDKVLCWQVLESWRAARPYTGWPGCRCRAQPWGGTRWGGRAGHGGGHGDEHSAGHDGDRLDDGVEAVGDDGCDDSSCRRLHKWGEVMVEEPLRLGLRGFSQWTLLNLL